MFENAKFLRSIFDVERHVDLQLDTTISKKMSPSSLLNFKIEKYKMSLVPFCMSLQLSVNMTSEILIYFQYRELVSLLVELFATHVLLTWYYHFSPTLLTHKLLCLNLKQWALCSSLGEDG